MALSPNGQFEKHLCSSSFEPLFEYFPNHSKLTLMWAFKESNYRLEQAIEKIFTIDENQDPPRDFFTFLMGFPLGRSLLAEVQHQQKQNNHNPLQQHQQQQQQSQRQPSQQQNQPQQDEYAYYMQQLERQNQQQQQQQQPQPQQQIDHNQHQINHHHQQQEQFYPIPAPQPIQSPKHQYPELFTPPQLPPHIQQKQEPLSIIPDDEQYRRLLREQLNAQTPFVPTVNNNITNNIPQPIIPPLQHHYPQPQPIIPPVRHHPQPIIPQPTQQHHIVSSTQPIPHPTLPQQQEYHYHHQHPSPNPQQPIHPLQIQHNPSSPHGSHPLQPHPQHPIPHQPSHPQHPHQPNQGLAVHHHHHHHHHHHQPQFPQQSPPQHHHQIDSSQNGSNFNTSSTTTTTTSNLSPLTPLTQPTSYDELSASLLAKGVPTQLFFKYFSKLGEDVELTSQLFSLWIEIDPNLADDSILFAICGDLIQTVRNRKVESTTTHHNDENDFPINESQVDPPLQQQQQLQNDNDDDDDIVMSDTVTTTNILNQNNVDGIDLTNHFEHVYSQTTIDECGETCDNVIPTPAIQIDDVNDTNITNSKMNDDYKLVVLDHHSHSDSSDKSILPLNENNNNDNTNGSNVTTQINSNTSPTTSTTTLSTKTTALSSTSQPFSIPRPNLISKTDFLAQQQQKILSKSNPIPPSSNDQQSQLLQQMNFNLKLSQQNQPHPLSDIQPLPYNIDSKTPPPIVPQPKPIPQFDLSAFNPSSTTTTTTPISPTPSFFSDYVPTNTFSFDDYSIQLEADYKNNGDDIDAATLAEIERIQREDEAYYKQRRQQLEQQDLKTAQLLDKQEKQRQQRLLQKQQQILAQDQSSVNRLQHHPVLQQGQNIDVAQFHAKATQIQNDRNDWNNGSPAPNQNNFQSKQSPSQSQSQNSTTVFDQRRTSTTSQDQPQSGRCKIRGEWVMIEGKKVYLHEAETDAQNKADLEQIVSKLTNSNTNQNNDNNNNNNNNGKLKRLDDRDSILDFTPANGFVTPFQLCEIFRPTNPSDDSNGFSLLEAILWPCLWGPTVLRPPTPYQLQNSDPQQYQYLLRNDPDQLSWGDDLDDVSMAWELDPQMFYVDRERLRVVLEWAIDQRSNWQMKRTTADEKDSLSLKEKIHALKDKIEFLQAWLSIISFFDYNSVPKVKPILTSLQVDLHGQDRYCAKTYANFFISFFTQRKRFLQQFNDQKHTAYLHTLGGSAQRPSNSRPVVFSGVQYEVPRYWNNKILQQYTPLYPGITNIYPSTTIPNQFIIITGRGVHSDKLGYSVVNKAVGEVLKTRKYSATAFTGGYKITLSRPNNNYNE